MSARQDPIFAATATVVRYATYACLTVCAVLIALSLIGLAAEIVLRYGFDAPMQHVHELTMIAFTFVYFLGAAALYARNDDIVIEFFYKRLPDGAGRVLLLIIYLAAVAAMAIVLWQTLALMDRQARIPTPSLRISQAIYGVPLALCAAFIAFCSLVDAWACWIWIRTGTRPHVWPTHDWEEGIETEAL